MKLEGWVAYWIDTVEWFAGDSESDLDDKIKEMLHENQDMVIPIKREITITIPPSGEEKKHDPSGN